MKTLAKYLTEYAFEAMAVVIVLYIIYAVIAILTGKDPFAPQVQFIVNIATLIGILAVLEDRREKRKKNV